jgi:hypothetical protein
MQGIRREACLVKREALNTKYGEQDTGYGFYRDEILDLLLDNEVISL